MNFDKTRVAEILEMDFFLFYMAYPFWTNAIMTFPDYFVNGNKYYPL